MLLAAPRATLNRFCTETLWRRLNICLFPRNPQLEILSTALSFALWHFVPQVIFPRAC